MRRITIPRRLTTALAMGLLALLITAVPTLAGVTWCRADPIVKLGGAEYQVLVDVPAANVAQINGPLDFTFFTQRGEERKVLFLDSGFNGHGETVAFADHNLKNAHVMKLDVKHSGSIFPVVVTVYKNNNLAATIYGDSSLITLNLPK